MAAMLRSGVRMTRPSRPHKMIHASVGHCVSEQEACCHKGRKLVLTVKRNKIEMWFPHGAQV